MTETLDRRLGWTPPPRPAWLAQLNELGNLMNARSVVPLDEESLTHEAMRNTGLTDFGEDGWRQHFRVLLDAIDREAKLTLFGRLLTRSDFLIYLEARLQVAEMYKRHPEIDDEVVKEPVFIIGFGRSGTTILQEVLSQDPQFRSVQRWEALFPVPPPETATYATDPRIERARGLVEIVHTASPEWRNMHAWGATIPVEDIEFTYSGFQSEVFGLAFRIPSYERYFAAQDPGYHFNWHKRLLKLLQWKHKGKHWLLKNPTHLQRIPYLLKAYPDAKFFFTHRDPITSTDSVIHVQGNVYYWRTDDPLGGGMDDDWVMAEARAKMWDPVIDWIEDGTLKKGSYTNFIYAKFMQDPMGTMENAYREIGLDIEPDAFARMREFLDQRNKGTHGNTNKYERIAEDDPAAATERLLYKRYQDFFGIPNEPRSA
jgi:hypothetical protein